MDFTEYIRIFNKEQKGQFTSFCIQLPLIFTVLYLYCPLFKEMDLYVQIIFSITASILTLFFFDIFLIFYYKNAKNKLYIRHYIAHSSCLIFLFLFDIIC